METSTLGRVGTFVVVTAVSIWCWCWATSGSFVCVKGTLGEQLQKAIETLDGAVDLGIKTSVSLIAVGAAVLIGLKSGVRLTAWTKSFLLISIILFGQSASAGVLWKLKMANGWINECLNLVEEQAFQRMFIVVLGFFLFGIIFSLIMVCVAAWEGSAYRGAHDET